MSLDVTLRGEAQEVTKRCHCCGNEYTEIVYAEYYDANITHNLCRLADAAGIYEVLWTPDEIGITKAKQLIAPLTEGLKKLIEDPQHFKTFDDKNEWGTYNQFLPWISEYLSACQNFPDADVFTSR